MTKLLNHIRHNLVAYLALFVALGGTSYAAINLPAGSVGTRALHNGAVTNKKIAKGAVGAADLDKKTIGGYVLYWARIGNDGTVISAQPRARTTNWVATAGASFPGGFVSWDRPIPATCFPLTTTSPTGGTLSSYASASDFAAPNRKAGVYIHLSTSGVPVNVAVVCRRP